MREQVKGLQKEYDKSEDDLKALQVRHDSTKGYTETWRASVCRHIHLILPRKVAWGMHLYDTLL